jgi:hypothetical protein
MAKTAVVAGTATAVHGSMTKRSDAKAEEAYEQEAANQAAYESQQELAQMQAQQAQAAPVESGGLGDDSMAKLKQLGDLHTAGVLTDDEFAAAKAKVLG